MSSGQLRAAAEVAAAYPVDRIRGDPEENRGDGRGLYHGRHRRELRAGDGSHPTEQYLGFP